MFVPPTSNSQFSSIIKMSMKLAKGLRRFPLGSSPVLDNLINLDKEVGCSNVAKLDPNDEDSLVYHLKSRFLNKQIYTYIESTVIAINPYEQLPLYSREILAAYQYHNILSLPPHIFALCEHVLRCLKERNADQCIIASGVNGSGKTESLKIAFNFFIFGSKEGSELNQIKTRLGVIPNILEAFGNASTEHNYNSTRAIYMIEIDFDFRGDPLGGQISDYFLEKTRVAKLEIYGYNFHIFYQLVSGAANNLLKFLKLKRNLDSYHLLKENRGTFTQSAAPNHAEDFRKTKLTLQVLGFASNEVIECFQILSFILKLGNVQFLRKANIDSTEGCTILADYEILDICEMFRLNFENFQKLLTQKVVRNQNDVFVAELSAESASKVKNCLCKALYNRLFMWIVDKINDSIKTKPSSNLARNNLTLLDSFGFENYNINCFEQLLANYFHEKVQQIFVDFNIRQEKEEYIREEIDWKSIDISSNDLLCDLIEKPCNGIFATLHEESFKVVYFREELFIQHLNERCSANLHYTEINNPVHINHEGCLLPHNLSYRRLSAGDINKSQPQLCFAIKHFQANVVYSINGFIEKNTEHIGRDWSQLFYQSEHGLLKILFPEGNRTYRKGASKLPITLANQFMIVVESIIAKLQDKQIHFIKCIRSNRLKVPNMFDEEYVYKQLCGQFVLEYSQFLRTGYVHHESYGSFFRRFRILSAQTWPTWTASLQNGVYFILFRLYGGELSNFAFGKNKIFVKYFKVMVELEELRRLKMTEVTVKIQKKIRGWIQRKKFIRMIYSQIKIARCYRNWKRKCYLIWLSNHLPSRSPLSREWPLCPRLLKESNHLLRKLYHKWRCQKFRARFDQINRNRMREKVTAMVLFRGKKASYRSSVSHPFRGDYIRLRQNVKWKRLLVDLGEVYVVFADLVSKITTRCGKFVQKLVVISTNAFLVLDHRTMEINHHIKLGDIFKICTSPFMDNVLIIHIYTDQKGLNSRAFLFESSHLIELITKLFLVIQNAVGRGPIVEIAQEFQVHTGKENLVLVFRSRTPPEISSHEVRISRKSNRLHITI